MVKEFETINDLTDVMLNKRKIEKLNEKFFNEAIEKINNEDYEGLEKMLKEHKKIRCAISKLEKNDSEKLMYEYGICNGIFDTLSEIYHIMEKETDNNKK